MNMSIKWKYKIELKEENVFDEIEEMRNITIPKKIKDFINIANAATPSLDKITIKNTEKVIGAILTFNKDDKDVDSVFTALQCINNKDLLPLAIDPAGAYFCYSLSEKCIVYYDNEEEIYYYTSYNLDGFINGLH